jgi:hypothetical protein
VPRATLSTPWSRATAPLLGNECLPNRCGCPSVRAVNRWDLLRVQRLGDLFQRHPLPEQRVDLLPPYVVTLVAEPMREPDVVGGEVTSVHLESRIVVGRRRPLGKRRTRVEVAATPEAVALGHLATHVDDLAIPGKLPDDSANSQAFELLNWSFSSVCRCRWTSCLRELLFVAHSGDHMNDRATPARSSERPALTTPALDEHYRYRRARSASSFRTGPRRLHRSKVRWRAMALAARPVFEDD